MGGDGKQEESGELETVSRQCSRPSYSHEAASFPCWGPPSSSGISYQEEVYVPWDAQRGKEDAAWKELQESTGARPYLQQGLGGFMDRNNVGDLVPA